MFTRPDNTYNDIREKSLMQWLDEIRRLEEENQLKAQYLKKMKEKNCK